METFNDVIIRAQASRLTRNPTKKQAVTSKKTKIRGEEDFWGSGITGPQLRGDV